jgi:hypothetical protein
MAIFLLPVEGLRIEAEWTVGPVRLLSSAAAKARVDELADLSPSLDSSASFAGARDSLGEWTAVEVGGSRTQ